MVCFVFNKIVHGHSSISHVLMLLTLKLQQIGMALLPTPVTSKSLPAPAETTPEINSVPKPEIKVEALTGISKPLSPYPSVSFPFHSE